MADRHRRYYAGGGLGSTTGLGYHPSSSGSSSSTAALMGRYQKSSTTANALDRLRTHLSPVGGYYKPLIRGLGGGRRDRDLDDVSICEIVGKWTKSERCANHLSDPDTQTSRPPQIEIPKAGAVTHSLGISFWKTAKEIISPVGHESAKEWLP